MPAFFIYLLKANIALTICYLAYRFGLRRLTFYTTNRFFLLFGIVFAALFPLIDLTRLFNGRTQLAGGISHYTPDWNALQQYLQSSESFTVWDLLQYIFWAGVLVMSVRFFIQLVSLWRIHTRSVTGRVNRSRVKIMQQPVNPFSFFRNIYLNPSLHEPEEIDAIIIHEKVHVKGWHSADVMAGELNNIFYWFNPGAWLMKTAIRENLEFIVDRKILQSGMDAKVYQYSLIKVSGVTYAAAIANNFNFSHLKQRIMMMNKKRSGKINILRYVLLLPLVTAIALFMFTSSRGQKNNVENKGVSILKLDTVQVLTKIPKGFHFNKKGYVIQLMERSGKGRVIDHKGNVLGPFDFYSFTKRQLEVFNDRYGGTMAYENLLGFKEHAEFLKSHPEVEEYFWKSENHILILSWGGKSRIYNLNNSSDIKAFEEKYGELPSKSGTVIEDLDKVKQDSVPPIPPPPPPVPASELPKAYRDFLNRNPEVDALAWSTPVNGKATVVRVRLKNGTTEKYHLNDGREMKEAEARYGKFPATPPPPPPPPAPPKPEVKFTPPAPPKPKVKFTPPVIVRDSEPPVSVYPSPVTGREKMRVVIGYPHPKNQPLFIVNGKESPSGLEGIDPNSIESINVLKDTAAINKYGGKGRHGVIEITRKNLDIGVVGIKKEAPVAAPVQTGIMLRDSASPEIIVRGFKGDTRPLVLVDGHVGSLDSLKPAEIKSISVLKDESAVSTYGKKGKGGVIIITTKKNSK